MDSDEAYRSVEIPELGLDDYMIVKTDGFSCGEGISKTGRCYQGICCKGKHYIFETPDKHNFDVSTSGKVMPKYAWEIVQIDEGGLASVKKITDAAKLEKIINEECKGFPFGDLDYTTN